MKFGIAVLYVPMTGGYFACNYFEISTLKYGTLKGMVSLLRALDPAFQELLTDKSDLKFVNKGYRAFIK